MVNIFSFAKNVGRTLIKHPVKSFQAGIKATTLKGVQKMQVPFSPAGAGIAGAGLIARSGGKIISGVRKLGGALGFGAKQTFKAKAIKTALFAGGTTAGYYAATGKLPTPSLRTIAAYVGGQASVPGAIAGAAHGGAKEFLEYVNKLRGNINVPNVPQTQAPDKMKYVPDQLIPNIPNILLPSPQISTSYTSPSAGFSPSVSVGGGDNLPLILALLGLGGVGAYAVHKLRKKRKRKKYKKRKRQ